MNKSEVHDRLECYDDGENLALLPTRYLNWLLEGERGLNSVLVMRFLVLGEPIGKTVFPRDTGDFWRLLVFFKEFPELESRIAELADSSDQWAAIAMNWERLKKASTNTSELQRELVAVFREAGLKI